MVRRAFGALLILLTVLVFASAASGQPLSDADTIRAAVSLLPRTRCVDIVPIDVNREVAADLRDTIRTLDAFVIRGQERIYVNTETVLFRLARTTEFYRHALSAVIWHELAHLEGADESRAQWEEERLWTAFIRDGRVDVATGLRYRAAILRRQGVHP